MPPAPAAGTGASAKKKEAVLCTLLVHMDVLLGGIELFFWKIGMGEDKNRNRIGIFPHDFHVFLHQNNPLKLVVFRPVRVLIANCLAGVNKL